MRKYSFIVVAILFVLITNIGNIGIVWASPIVDGQTDYSIQIFDNFGNFLLERSIVNVGDDFIINGNKKYKVTTINECSAIAEYICDITLPKVNLESIEHINNEQKVIALYMTHNDESYVEGDGVSSVYGAGGIHDIAKNFATALTSLGITTYINETLHIPHDSGAYSRSKLTANSMLTKYSPNAIFDIHRDGASRGTYVTKYEGVDRCKVRIVVGKANPNYHIQEEFALYLVAVAEQLYPWLFLDIYYASGHYNQALSNKALLFEMGSHMVEKTLVAKTMPALAKVVNTTLFYTTTDGDDNSSITIGGDLDQNNTIDEVLESKAKIDNNTGSIIALVVVGVIITSTVVLILMVKLSKDKKN